VTVLRGENELTFTMQRCEVHDMTVASSVLKGDIGYISVDSFSDTTADEFESALEDMKEKGITKIILDLRNNPGGYTDAAVRMAQMIVPEGVIIKTEFRNEDSNTVYMSELKEKTFDFCVLVNGNTASSSEILASAIQDSGAGVLVGERTYGKGVIQNMFSLPGGLGMKITTGKYITRNGSEINNIGITPDYDIPNGIKNFDTSALTSMDYKTKWEVGDKDESIIGAKERLYLLGYNVDIYNDEYTLEEMAAVVRFQQDQGLYAYGVIDITTQTRLENETHKLEQTVDNQFKFAYSYFGGVLEDED
jgi:carboxyl-terminal processing protease